MFFSPFALILESASDFLWILGYWHLLLSSSVSFLVFYTPDDATLFSKFFLYQAFTVKSSIAFFALFLEFLSFCGLRKPCLPASVPVEERAVKCESGLTSNCWASCILKACPIAMLWDVSHFWTTWLLPTNPTPTGVRCVPQSPGECFTNRHGGGGWKVTWTLWRPVHDRDTNAHGECFSEYVYSKLISQWMTTVTADYAAVALILMLLKGLTSEDSFSYMNFISMAFLFVNLLIVLCWSV